MIDYELHTNTKIMDIGYINNRKQFIDNFYKNGDYPVSIEDINNMQIPVVFNNSLIAQNYPINNQYERSRFQSSVVEFWAPITNIILKDIINDRYYISTFGRTWDKFKQFQIYQSYQHKGYIQIHLKSNDGNYHFKKLHRVMLLTFCYFDGCEKLQVNHKNNIRDDNRLWNLEWVTPSQNSIQRVNNGTNSLFGRGYDYNITDDIAYEILYLRYDNKMMVKDISYFMTNKYNFKISIPTIKNVVSRYEKRWVYDKFMKERSSTIEKHSEI